MVNYDRKKIVVKSKGLKNWIVEDDDLIGRYIPLTKFVEHIEELCKELNEFYEIDEHIPHIYINTGTGESDYYPYEYTVLNGFELALIRDETDEEYSKRIESEIQKEKEKEEKQLLLKEKREREKEEAAKRKEIEEKELKEKRIREAVELLRSNNIYDLR